ncbi:lipooligosaccharide transport system permease protein [Nakamurella panacisegetis]|uniref:Transport permease protein n=1 Tax=Nakamurella panacisegetis TaxID=1090615 RepID=A0A1H0HUT3_9ACTN|nr:ABC transporter permease [Nakamurella panacisegetis]SDO22985.1 lipooligosaccharide transport system permease protein [Nakamurella panacisegetis]
MTGAATTRSGTLMVVEYRLRVARRFLTSSIFSSIVTPLLYLVALGVGLGSLVDAGNGTASLGGVDYVRFLAPALLTAAAVQTGVGEASFPVLGGFKWTQVFWGITSTPVTPGQVADAQVLFIGLRLALGSAIYYLVLLAFGVAGRPAGVLMIPIAVLTGLSCAVWVVALSAVLRKDGQAFNVVFRFGLVPMTLVSGSFFPISALPVAARPLAWISPLWHGNELARAAALGDWRWWPGLGHLALLVLLTGLGWWLARAKFERRLVV